MREMRSRQRKARLFRKSSWSELFEKLYKTLKMRVWKFLLRLVIAAAVTVSD
jgi:hypothetical protein